MRTQSVRIISRDEAEALERAVNAALTCGYWRLVGPVNVSDSSVARIYVATLVHEDPCDEDRTA